MDDHLRNHAFLYSGLSGWRLSPAYDLNASVDKEGLSLNIDMNDNSLDFNLAKSVGIYFRLNENQMDSIILEVKDAVSQWKDIASKIGIIRSEQMLMENAFNFT